MLAAMQKDDALIWSVYGRWRYESGCASPDPAPPYRADLTGARAEVIALRQRLRHIDDAISDYMLGDRQEVLMLIVVKAIDVRGKATASAPLAKKEALMKVWEFKTSGCTQIRTFNATTNEEINILQKSD